MALTRHRLALVVMNPEILARTRPAHHTSAGPINQTGSSRESVAGVAGTAGALGKVSVGEGAAIKYSLAQT